MDRQLIEQQLLSRSELFHKHISIAGTCGGNHQLIISSIFTYIISFICFLIECNILLIRLLPPLCSFRPCMLLNSLYFKLSRVPRKHTLVLIYTNSTFYKQFDKNNFLTYISHMQLATTHLFLAKHCAQFTNIVLYVVDTT